MSPFILVSAIGAKTPKTLAITVRRIIAVLQLEYGARIFTFSNPDDYWDVSEPFHEVLRRIQEATGAVPEPPVKHWEPVRGYPPKQQQPPNPSAPGRPQP